MLVVAILVIFFSMMFGQYSTAISLGTSITHVSNSVSLFFLVSINWFCTALGTLFFMSVSMVSKFVANCSVTMVIGASCMTPIDDIFSWSTTVSLTGVVTIHAIAKNNANTNCFFAECFNVAFSSLKSPFSFVNLVFSFSKSAMYLFLRSLDCCANILFLLLFSSFFFSSISGVLFFLVLVCLFLFVAFPPIISSSSFMFVLFLFILFMFSSSSSSSQPYFVSVSPYSSRNLTGAIVSFILFVLSILFILFISSVLLFAYYVYKKKKNIPPPSPSYHHL
mmetsp:Transcript_12688/g.19042  ORF Transcript_12688/g.19042 Transcript_12688/m.19042 type:complete len:279 (-) Transcript_12688:32-868(-)